MAALREKDYRPPFISEVDEPIWEDCTINATLMGLASWTLGEVVTGPDWRPLSRAELKKLRERMRNSLGPKFQHGGTNLDDTARAAENIFPWLPAMPRFDKPGEDYKFNKMIDALRSNSVVIAQGNPSQIKNVNSGLRRWTRSDDFGHAVLLERANADSVYVMDPLGRGAYDGQWVPISEVKQFLFFTSAHEPLIAVLPRGEQSPAARAVRPLQKTIDTQSKLIAASKTEIATLNTNNEVLKAQVDSVNSQVAALTAERDALAVREAALTIQVAELQAQLAVVPPETPEEPAPPIDTVAKDNTIAQLESTNRDLTVANADLATQLAKYQAADPERQGVIERIRRLLLRL